MNRHSLIRSFGFAILGIWQAIKRERNLKIHLSATILAISAGIILGISRVEWLVLILIISLVLAAEIFNSAVENAGDLYDEKLNLKYGESTFSK